MWNIDFVQFFLLHDGHAIACTNSGSHDLLVLNSRCRSPSGALRITDDHVFEIVFTRSIYMNSSVDQ